MTIKEIITAGAKGSEKQTGYPDIPYTGIIRWSNTLLELPYMLEGLDSPSVAATKVDLESWPTYGLRFVLKDEFKNILQEAKVGNGGCIVLNYPLKSRATYYTGQGIQYVIEEGMKKTSVDRQLKER